MCADSGERAVVEHTGEVYPGLYVAGMAAGAVHGAPRMGPIFGGMLLSGRKAARLILRDLDGEVTHAAAGELATEETAR